ncbi:MFS transporter [Pseudonocardia nigra]|uniref:MFS transporter n=1 Tax=Pseudonocardia nigra TaxID=1921578 RepID=UPI001FE7C1EB|nr:MFS transporter [Pseudonocardia nigra]
MRPPPRARRRSLQNRSGGASSSQPPSAASSSRSTGTCNAVLAPFFAAQLFPGGGTASLLVAYAGFAVGFVARPLGSALIGRLADKRGRRFGLTLSMSVIAAASLLLAVIPSRDDIGIWAAVLVVVARLVQGLAYGGETPTVAAYVTETAPPRHRFLFSGISYGGIIIGSLLSFGVVTVLNAVVGADALADGAWRWGFVLAAVIGVAAVWVRRCAPESDAYEQETAAHGTQRPPVREVFTRHPLACAALFLMSVGGTVAFYFSLVYLPVYAEHVGAADQASASSFMTVVFAVTLVAMLLAGMLTDRVGAIPVLRGAYLALFLGMLPLMIGLEAGAIGFHTVAIALAVLVAVPVATTNVLSGLLFPIAVRAVGAGIVGASAIALFGGTFPLLAEALTAAGHTSAIPYYVAATMALALAGTFVAARVPGFAAASRPSGSGRATDSEEDQ